MKTILIGSNNKKKIIEIEKLLSPYGFKVFSLKEAGITKDVEESENTFEGNALLKAKGFYDERFDYSISDDSGLEVDILNNEPGVYSARFAGEPCDDERNNDLLLDKLSGVPSVKRTARFVSVIALYSPKLEKPLLARGEVDGIILEERVGSGGFGYDPLFYYPPYSKTFAQLTIEEKNEVSHRAKALKKLGELIEEYGL